MLDYAVAAEHIVAARYYELPVCDIAALPGRFLPKLGRPFPGRPFSFQKQLVPRLGRLRFDKSGDESRQRLAAGRKAWSLFHPLFVQIKPAIDLDLDGVNAVLRATIMAGCESTGIGTVPANRETLPP